MNPIIKLEGVDFCYDKGKPTEVHALNNVSLEIMPGEYVSFFGPSGCGKSTVLYVISGVERPDSGKVIINGQDLMGFSAKELAIYRQVGIGIIFQNFNLIPSIKIIDNVTLPMALLGISMEKREESAMKLLERLGIANVAERYPYELSGGQQQRVGIARALANDPPIILADEPIGNLDSINATNVLDLLKEFNEKDGKTVIMVTHEAWSLRDVGKTFYMRDGAIVKTEEKKDKQQQLAKKSGSAYYYKNLFPELPKAEVRAKTTSNMILRGYSQAEIKRLEHFLVDLFLGKIDKDVFRMVLDRPYKDGGVGLWKQKAKKIADYAEALMNEEKDLEDIYKKIEENPEAPLYDEVEKICAWLVGDCKTKLTALQAERLHEAIGERIRNIITLDNFQRVLDLPKDEGGVGLRVRTSFNITEKLEAILSREEPDKVEEQEEPAKR